MTIENVGPGGVSNSYGVRGTGQPSVLTANKTLTALDEGKIYECSTAITITVPAGLSPSPNVIIIPPASGNVTVIGSGGALINGVGTGITRDRATNPAGVALMSYYTSDAYGLSGS